MRLKKYIVVYMVDGETKEDVWEAESASQCRKVALDFYRQDCDGFQGIVSITDK